MKSWLIQSLVAMVVLVPAWLSIGFFDRNYQVKPEVFLIWYMIGLVISVSISQGFPFRLLLSTGNIVFVILAIGIAFGGLANILLFRAVASAPNPGIPMIIVTNGANLGVFLGSIFLSRLMPKYFPPVKLDNWSLMGVVLVIIGLFIIIFRKQDF